MKIGILGYGSIGRRHANNLQALGHDIACYDPQVDPNNYERVIKHGDAFVIASPTSAHYGSIFDLSLMDAPMLIEKPIVATARQAANLNVVNKEHLFVGYNLRFLRMVQKAKEIIDEGRIKPLWARFTCAQYNDRPAYLRDGVILNWSHEIDLALYLMGPAEVKASNTVLRDGQDVLTDIILEHASGVTSTIHLDYLKEPQIRGFTVVGEDSTIMCDIADGMFMHEKAWSKDMLVEGDFDDCYVREMEQFIRFCETGDLGDGCSADEALQVLDICLKVRQQAGLSV